MNNATLIELMALKAELDGMVAENMQREAVGHSMAYGEDAFALLADRIRALKSPPTEEPKKKCRCNQCHSEPEADPVAWRMTWGDGKEQLVLNDPRELWPNNKAEPLYLRPPAPPRAAGTSVTTGKRNSAGLLEHLVTLDDESQWWVCDSQEVEELADRLKNRQVAPIDDPSDPVARRLCWVVYDYPGGPTCFSTTNPAQIKPNPRQEVVQMTEVKPGDIIISAEKADRLVRFIEHVTEYGKVSYDILEHGDVGALRGK